MPATSLTILESAISFEPCWAPGGTSARDPRSTVTEFADGYEQISKDGINNERREWNLKLEALNGVEFKEIDSYLRARGSHEAFLFIPPGPEGTDPDTGATDRVTVRCTRRAHTYLQGAHYDLSVTFEERFI